MSPRTRKSTRTTVTLILLVIIVIAGIAYVTTGNDFLGIFTVTDAPLPPTSTYSPTAPGMITRGTADWWEVYFTDPLTVNDPENYANSIEQVLIDKVNAARTSIHIVSFEFDLTPVAEALIAAHQRGVDVRWVTDDEHGLEADSEPDGGQFALLTGAGIEVRSDDRSALMHDKFWIFDGETVWTGSTNITVNGIFKQNNNVIVVHSTQFGPTSPSTVDQQSAIVDGTPIHVLFSAEDGVVDRIIAFVQGAQTSVRFLAFSFTDYPLADAMRQRAAAGVDVAGVFEKVGSETESAELRTLFCAQIPVRQDGNGSFMHDKLIIVDNHIVITGSLNFSSSADEDNDENVIIIDNAEIAALYVQEFEHVYAQGSDPDPAEIVCP
ncbi:MAG: hypothetical protein HY781_05965 [Chloroflexi bacterium]|nr:hypothetical protein [Chloroflexota bacterium]